MIESAADLPGEVIPEGEPFSFACRPDLACFNTCCRNKRLLLLPYDVIRLRRNLDLGSAQFLGQYAEMEMDPTSGWPALRIRLDEHGVCPFVSSEGCRVYPDRPTACRVYPLARAVAPGARGTEPRQVFLRQETKGCQGWEGGTEHTIESWVADQGLAEYMAANNRLLGLWLHPGRRGKLELTPPQIQAVIAATYNLEALAQALRQPGFAERQGLDPQKAAAALEDDEALLLLGRDWLIGQLFDA